MGEAGLHDQAQRLRQLARQATAKHRPGAGIDPTADAAAVSRPCTRVLAVTSGKGGVGKTSVSLNLAIALGQRGLSVGLIDADLGLANLDLMLGVLPEYDLTSIISGQKKAREVLVDGPAGIKLLAGGSGAADLANLTEYQLRRVLDILADLDGMFDVYIIDTGAGIGRQVMTFVAAADEVLVVTTPDPTAVADAYGLIKVLRNSTKGAWNAVVRVVVTMAETESESFAVFRRLDQVTRRFLGLSLHYLGCLEKDAVVARAVREQKPFTMGHPTSRPAKRILEMAGNLTREWGIVAGKSTSAHGAGRGGDGPTARTEGGQPRSDGGLAGAVWRMWQVLRRT